MADVTARDATEGTAEDQGLAEGATKSIWHSIFLEVDKVSSQLPGALLLGTASYRGLCSGASMCAFPHLSGNQHPQAGLTFDLPALFLCQCRALFLKRAQMHDASHSWHLLRQSWVSLIMLVVLQSADLTIGKLTNSLRMPHVAPRQAADAIKHLLHLQAEGARSTRNLNPIKLYLEAQVCASSPRCIHQSCCKIFA